MCNIGYEVANLKKKKTMDIVLMEGKQAQKRSGQQGATIAATSVALKLALILFRGT